MYKTLALFVIALAASVWALGQPRAKAPPKAPDAPTARPPLHEKAAPPSTVGRRIVVVLDRSGSMQGAPFARAEEAILKLASSLGPNDRLGLVSYASRAELDLQLTAGSPALATRVRNALHDLRPGGSSDLAAGIALAYRGLAVRTTGPRQVLVLTDGAANDGDPSPSVLDSLVRAGLRRGIVTSTFALGPSADEVRLRDVARYGGGAFYDALDAPLGPALIRESFRHLREDG